MLLVIHCITVAWFLLLGLMFLKGKGAFLIAGYNTATREEKARYDEKALCRFMGKLMIALALCWSLLALSHVLQRTWLLWLGLGLFLAVLFGGVIYANTGGRFKK